MLDDQAGQLIGFATLPDQVHRKSIKKGFEFTLIVVGETGLGKSTLINSLFLTDLYKDKVVPTAEERISKTVEIKKSTVEIEEKGVKLKLNVIDTPGFGDSLDCSDCWKQVADFIEAQFEQYFRDESGLNRKNITDNRVHCCLYFIPPYGHGLRPLDREFMKRLQDKVNIVPVIAKADTLTPAEVKKLKAKESQAPRVPTASLQDFTQQATPAVNTSEASGSAADMFSTSGRRYTKKVAAVVQVLDGPCQSPTQHPVGWDTRTLGAAYSRDAGPVAMALASWRPVLPMKSCLPIVADKNLAVTEKRWWNKLRAGKSLRKMGDCGDRNDNHFGCSSRYRDGRKHAGVERRAVETLGMPWTTVE
ncbi:SEPT5 [Branchiostoma lanceolatum]|uniref:SEPT5 protein n=1 Tax=Branchiostoma lanceolatum TaxID=7740 RepID=A0A8J9YQ02_BRALA|nr:SEPT5 [Branchiostoma lanceolatum]